MEAQEKAYNYDLPALSPAATGVLTPGLLNIQHRPGPPVEGRGQAVNCASWASDLIGAL